MNKFVVNGYAIQKTIITDKQNAEQIDCGKTLKRDKPVPYYFHCSDFNWLIISRLMAAMSREFFTTSSNALQ